jgi:hypothetical protein
MKQGVAAMFMRIASLAVALSLGAAHAHAQRMTEMFIPIGESPGVSGKLSVIGVVESVDPKARTITVAAATGTQPVRIGDRTWIWLDRSKEKLRNEKGSMADLQTGRRVEVKFESADPSTAEWIKVEVVGAEAGAVPRSE